MGSEVVDWQHERPSPALAPYVERMVGYRYGSCRQIVERVLIRRAADRPPAAAALAHAWARITRSSGRARIEAVAGEIGWSRHMAREWNDLAGCPPSAWPAAETLPFVQDPLPEPVPD